MEAVNGVSDGDKGGPPPPSPLTGCYLLIVIGEPHCNNHKDIILQRVAKGLLSWDVNDCLVDLEKELAIITEQALEGEEARYGERLIQFASENLVTEILIHPVVSTFVQCVRNLLSSFTRHRHIIHAGYTFANNGSWMLQDGTFSLADFAEAFQEIEVLRVIRAYENGISLDIHCAPEGDWTRLPKESFVKSCKVRVNPNDILTAGSPSITKFINYLGPFLIPAELDNILESSDVVGNIRFSRPTLYVFPGGQGDAALFGINGFNMLLDGGFSRKACFWDFVRHLDRLDAVLFTRLNNSNVNGINAVLRRKKQNAMYPQLGHFFCNIQERKAILSPDGDKDKDPLLINLMEEGQEMICNLRQLGLAPQVCYRDSEPINLYHKVGHGTLDMYVLSPAKDSKEVREFLHKWNNNDQKLFANQKNNKEFLFPLQNLVSVCALLVWQPANPEDTITRILFPGSSPQNKIFEGLDRIKSLEFIKYPVCSEKSLTPVSIVKSRQSVLDKIIPSEKRIPVDNKREKPKPPVSNTVNENDLKNGDMNGTERTAPVKKSDSSESEKSFTKTKKIIENGDKPKPKPKQDTKAKPRSDSQQRKVKAADKKPSPTTPKKTVEKINGDAKLKLKASPSATPAKSTKDANNRKVLESKIKAAPKRETAKAPAVAEKKEIKVERKPISRRSKDIAKASQSPSKKPNGVQKPDSISRKGKLDKEGTTDSSTVSTPSADQDSILKKDISKLSSDEIQLLKDHELAELKEEQEAVKELEAVFRKGEFHKDKPSDFRKIKDLSIDDKLESEEYLIIEKTEIEQVSVDTKEDVIQKIARDTEESEKDRKLSSDIPVKVTKETSDDKREIQDDAVKTKEDAIEASKDVSATSPEDKVDLSTDKKTPDKDNEAKEVAQESQPDEKGSTNIESGQTTTAPTLPEDERMPLDEIKEDNGDQVIEEKHVKEETKEKDIPVLTAPIKSFENISKLPPVVGIRLDKQTHIRDIVKTPDEVADLPVHEEVDIGHYDEYAKEKSPDDDEKKVDDKGAATTKPNVDNAQKPEIDLKNNKKDNEAVSVGDILKKVTTEVSVKVDEKKAIDKAVILSKSPDDGKDKNELKQEIRVKSIELEKVPQQQAEVKPKSPENNTNVAKSVVTENIVNITVAETKHVEDSSKDLIEKIESGVEEVIEKGVQGIKEIVTETKETIASALRRDSKQEETTEESKIQAKHPEHLNQDVTDVKSKIKHGDDQKQETPENEEDDEEKSVYDVIEDDFEKSDFPELPQDEVLGQSYEKDVEELSKETKIQAAEQIKHVKEGASGIQKLDEKLQLLKDAAEEAQEKSISEIVKLDHKIEEPQHAESVIIPSDSQPDSPMSDDKKLEIEEKAEVRADLGRKSPKEREEDVAKIVASVAEVLKSEAPLEEFEGKVPLDMPPFNSYTTELRETHITTVGSPVTDESKIIKSEPVCPKNITKSFLEEERKIAPIHEEMETEEIRKVSREFVASNAQIVADSKQTPVIALETEDENEGQDADGCVVHRMLVTASSEDGGEETEICPPGTIIFSKSSESSGRSSPDIQSQKIPQKASILDASEETIKAKTISDHSAEVHVQEVTKEEPVGDPNELKRNVGLSGNIADEIKDSTKQIPGASSETQVTEKVDVEATKDSSKIVLESDPQLTATDHTTDQDNKAITKDGKDLETGIQGIPHFKEIEKQLHGADGHKDALEQPTDGNSLEEILYKGIEQKEVTAPLKPLEESSVVQQLTELEDTGKAISKDTPDTKFAIVEGLQKVEKLVVDVLTADREEVKMNTETERRVEEKLLAFLNDERQHDESKENESDNAEKTAQGFSEKTTASLHHIEKEDAEQKTSGTSVATPDKIKENIIREPATADKAESNISKEAEIPLQFESKEEKKDSPVISERENEMKTSEIVSKEIKPENKSIFTGLEKAEELVVGVITADRLENLEIDREDNKTSSKDLIEKIESGVEEVIEKGVQEVKEIVTETKETISSAFRRDSKQEETLEKSAHDIEKNYDIVAEMAKSVIFEKCYETTDEERAEKEKILERSAESLEDNFEAVTDMSKSMIFEKCERPLDQLQKEEKVLEKAAKDIVSNYEIVTEMTKSISFDKCEKLLDQDQVQKSSKDTEFNSETPISVDKEVECVTKPLASIEEKFDDIVGSGVRKADVDKQPHEVIEVKKSVEDSFAEMKTLMDQVQQPTKSHDVKKVELQLHSSVAQSSEADTKEETVISDFLHKIEHDVEKAIETRAEDLKEFVEHTKDSISSIFRRESIKESEVLENKDLEEFKNDIKESSSALTVESKEASRGSSGKATPEIAQPANLKVESKDSLLSGKSSPAMSGKSTPEIKETEIMQTTSKDSLLSGKSSPLSSAESKDTDKENVASEEQPTCKKLAENTGDKKMDAKQSDELKGIENLGFVDKVEHEIEDVVEKGVEETKEFVKDTKEVVTSIFRRDSHQKEQISDMSKSMVSEEFEKTEQSSIQEEHKSQVSLKEETKVQQESVKGNEHSYETVTEKCQKDIVQSDIKEVIKTEQTSGKGGTTDNKQLEQSPNSLEVSEVTEKKLSVSDVEISFKDPEEANTGLKLKSQSVESKIDSKDSMDSGIGTDPEKKSDDMLTKINITASFLEQEIRKANQVQVDTQGKDKTIIGCSLTTLDSSKTSTDDVSFSGKSTPDIAEVEKLQEFQETVKQEKHILGSSTPPTVPVSPVVKDTTTTEVENIKPLSTVKTCMVSSLKDNEVRSDDYEIGVSTSSEQFSKTPHLFETTETESEEEDDVPGSPMSVTSQVAHSRSSSRYDFEDDRIGTKYDPMNTSFYGALPDDNEPKKSLRDESDFDFEKAMTEHRQTRGEDLVTGPEDSVSYLYEVTQAKFTTSGAIDNANNHGGSQLDQINKNGASSLMTASFIGSELPGKDPFDAWGKPLGLPSPAPPNDNSGTPKKERRVPSNVTAKNKLNDDRKRSESPSKYKNNKRFNPVYVDLTYVPHHGNAYYAYLDFFKRIRARYYVFSGIEPSREVYTALLEAKQTWEDKELEVTIIPTYDTDILGYWVAENEEVLTKYKIDLSPSASRCTINLQDHETSCSAYRLEF